MDYIQLGKQVRKQRGLCKLTQEQLAEKAGISCAFVGHIERGEKKASIETVVSLCNALTISPTVLLQDSLSAEVMETQTGIGGPDNELISEIIRVFREYRLKEKKEAE